MRHISIIALTGGVSLLSFVLPLRSFGPSMAIARTLGPDTIADLAEKAAPAVVNIDTVTRRAGMPAEMDPFFQFFGIPGEGFRNTPRQNEQRGVGSGFVLDAGGLVVTNHHVIRGSSTIKVTLQDGRSFDARIVGQDPSSDLALLRVKATGLPTLKLATAGRIRVGEWVVAIGSPLGLSTTVTAGIVSALNRDVSINERVAFIQTDAPINPGNSGGPLLNLDGEVVGVNTAIAARAQGIGFAIPVETVQMVTQQLRTTGKVERAWLGVMIEQLTPERARQLFVKTEPGVLVREVTENSPAAQAGVLDGDVILQIDGQPVQSPSQLIQAVARHRVKDSIRLLVSREGQRREFTVTLGTAAPPRGDDAGGAGSGDGDR